MVSSAARAPLALPPCPECRGGGEINGLECRECHGSKRSRGRARRDWRALWRRPVQAVSGAAAVAAGAALRGVPGVGGAVAVTAGVAAIVHAIWHWIPPYAPALLVGGAFGLMIDRG